MRLLSAVAVLLILTGQVPAGPFRVGGDVRAPVLTHRVEPVWTPMALKARISGIVIVEAIIDETGRVTNVHVLKPLPFGLDQAAIDAVKQWQFRPGTLNGRPVPVFFNLTVNFRPPSILPPAELTPRDVAVIEAALNVAVPEFTDPLLVVNEMLVPHSNGEYRRIESLKLHRPITLVDRAVKPAWSRHETRVVLAPPAYFADGSQALVEIVVTRPHEGWLEPIRETLLMKQQKGIWRLSQRRSLRLADATSTQPLRVGGDVTAPVIVSRVEPQYTPAAAKARIAGIVIIEAIIDKEGRITDARVLKALPFGLDQAAVDAVKQWRFRPGTLNGDPVPVIWNVTVSFRPPEPAASPR